MVFVGSWKPVRGLVIDAFTSGQSIVIGRKQYPASIPKASERIDEARHKRRGYSSRGRTQAKSTILNNNVKIRIT